MSVVKCCFVWCQVRNKPSFDATHDVLMANSLSYITGVVIKDRVQPVTVII